MCAKTQRLVDESAEKSQYAHFFFKTQKGNMMIGVFALLLLLCRFYAPAPHV